MGQIKTELLKIRPDLQERYEFHDNGTLTNDLRVAMDINVISIYEKILEDVSGKTHVLFGSRLACADRTSNIGYEAYRVSKAALAASVPVLRGLGKKVKLIEMPHTHTAMWPGGGTIENTVKFIIFQLGEKLMDSENMYLLLRTAQDESDEEKDLDDKQRAEDMNNESTHRHD